MNPTRTAPSQFEFEDIFPGAADTFTQLYAIYAELFPLPDERESPEAFLEIAALNDQADLQKLYGPWHEIVSGIRLRHEGTLVGGNIFGVTTSPFHLAFGCQASIQDIYLFLEPRARGNNVMAHAKAYMETRALATYGFEPRAGKMPPLIFLEVNNPLRMTPAEINEDTANSGINPYRRYVYWRRNGFAPLDFRYVQPPLRSEASAVTYLDLFCTAGLADAIPADLISAHLSAFISISVLKGRASGENPEFARMAEEELRPGRMVGFVPTTSREQQIISREAVAAARSGAE